MGSKVLWVANTGGGPSEFYRFYDENGGKLSFAADSKELFSLKISSKEDRVKVRVSMERMK